MHLYSEQIHKICSIEIFSRIVIQIEVTRSMVGCDIRVHFAINSSSNTTPFNIRSFHSNWYAFSYITVLFLCRFIFFLSMLMPAAAVFYFLFIFCTVVVTLRIRRVLLCIYIEITLDFLHLFEFVVSQNCFHNWRIKIRTNINVNVVYMGNVCVYRYMCCACVCMCIYV